MTTFDRHIIGRILLGFVPLTILLVLFYVALHYVEYMDDFIDRGASLSDVFTEYYPAFVPEIIRLISPLALFLAAVLATARLAQQLQFAVLMTSGVSLYRLLVPYLFLGVIVTGAFWWFNGWVVPEANRVRIEYEYRYFKDQRGPSRVRNLHLQDTPAGVVTAEFFDRNALTAYDVSLQRFDPSNRIEERVDAREMIWVDSLRVWRMFEVTRRVFDSNREKRKEAVALVDTTLNVLPRDLSRRERDVELLTIPEARTYLDALRRSGVSEIGRPMVEYWSKFTYPFANLILILIALPLASVRRPGGQALQLGLGLAVAFAYLVLQKLTEPLGYSETLLPGVASALPHVVFGLVALLMIRNART